MLHTRRQSERAIHSLPVRLPKFGEFFRVRLPDMKEALKTRACIASSFFAHVQNDLDTRWRLLPGRRVNDRINSRRSRSASCVKTPCFLPSAGNGFKQTIQRS
jgi:hypothetical protein